MKFRVSSAVRWRGTPGVAARRWAERALSSSSVSYRASYLSSEFSFLLGKIDMLLWTY